jgi:lipopolysaccharide assembly protein A
MRLIRFLIALLCIAAGVVIGALNPQPVSFDFGFITLHGTLGVSLLMALLVGAIAGGLMLAASVILPMRQQLRRARMRHGEQPAASLPGDS